MKWSRGRTWLVYLSYIQAYIGINKRQRRSRRRSALYGNLGINARRRIKLALYKSDPNCYYCRVNFATVREATLDHFIPFSLDRALALDPNNYKLACGPCNFAKDNIDPRITSGLVDTILRKRNGILTRA